MEFLWAIAIVIALLLYAFVIDPRICRKKLYKQVNSIGGTVTNIDFKLFLLCGG